MSDHCPRLDDHTPHEYISHRLTDGYRLPYVDVRILECPGAPLVEGGALDTHDCGNKVHPADIRHCCTRCTGTICPHCEPCRRVS